MDKKELTNSDLLSKGDHICTFGKGLYIEFHNKDLFHNGDMYHIIGIHCPRAKSVCTIVTSKYINSPLYLLTFSSQDMDFANKVNRTLITSCKVRPETTTKDDFRYTISRTELGIFINCIYRSLHRRINFAS